MSKNKTKKIFFVGGEDISLRIPMIKLLETFKYNVSAVGSEDKYFFEDQNINYYKYSLKRRFSLFSDFFTFYDLYKLFKIKKPDIVQTFDTKPNVIAVFAAYFAGVPRIIRTINGMGSIFAYNSIRSYALRIIYCLFQFITSLISEFTIFQNKDDLNYFLSMRLMKKKKAIYVGGSGVSELDFKKNIGTPDYLEKLKNEFDLHNKCVIILISRIIKAKGIIEYLESAKSLNKSEKGIKFLLVGPVESGDDSIDISSIKKYEEFCVYLGYRNDISSLIHLSDIVVLPSYYKEGVPRTLIEGASLSKPLISTDVSGCRDIVLHQHNGIIIPPKNVDKLSKAIKFLSDNPDVRRDMGIKGKELVRQKFSLEVVCEGWRGLY